MDPRPVSAKQADVVWMTLDHVKVSIDSKVTDHRNWHGKVRADSKRLCC